MLRGFGLLIAIAGMLAASVLQAQGYLPPQLAGKQFEDYYDIDFGNAHIIWLCRNGQFVLRNGVSMGNDRNPGKGEGDETGRWTVLSRLGAHQVSLDAEGNVFVDKQRKWYLTGNAAC